MYDKELVREILMQIKEASERVLRRFESIQSVEDFTNSEAGMEKLDAICMQLIADRSLPISRFPLFWPYQTLKSTGLCVR
jgi:hypothetical protein